MGVPLYSTKYFEKMAIFKIQLFGLVYSSKNQIFYVDSEYNLYFDRILAQDLDKTRSKSIMFTHKRLNSPNWNIEMLEKLYSMKLQNKIIVGFVLYVKFSSHKNLDSFC